MIKHIKSYPRKLANKIYSITPAGRTRQQVNRHGQTINSLEGAVSYLRELVETNTHKQNRIDERLNDIVHQIAIINEASRAKSNKAATPKSDLLVDDHLLDNFYVEFEKWFRGSDEEIKERQREYVPYFTKSKINSSKYPVVDIGCGRGEFVQLLGESKIRAVGLDPNKSMVDHVKAKGLEAIEGDALTYLRSLPSNSIMAITGFHIVEHIPFADLVRIFDECYRVLVRDGFIVFETPNPENLIVGACNFYADPSHIKPLPPAFLDFTLKTRGFNKSEIKRLHPIKQDIKDDNPLVQELANRVFGPQDYAVIAYKS